MNLSRFVPMWHSLYEMVSSIHKVGVECAAWSDPLPSPRTTSPRRASCCSSLGRRGRRYR